MITKKSFIFSYFLWTLLLVSLDQVIKCFIVNFYPQIIFNNRGNLFGFISTPTIAFILECFGLIILVILILKYIRLKEYLIALILISSGAISNLIDRLWQGSVIDYLNFFNWNYFNLSDILIVIGILLFLVNHLKYTKENL